MKSSWRLEFMASALPLAALSQLAAQRPCSSEPRRGWPSMAGGHVGVHAFPAIGWQTGEVA